MKRPSRREIGFIVAGIPGVALLFLPFVWGVVPVRLLAETSERDLCEWQFKVVVAVALLAVPILASSCRQAMSGPLTRWEARAAYALSLGALAATTFLMLATIMDGGAGSSIEETVVIPSTILLAAGAAIVLVVTREGRVPPGIHAHVAMLVAWMPNAAFCLSSFGQLGAWGAGFYATVIAFPAYAVEATLRVRAAHRGGGEAGPGAPPP